MDLDAYMNTCIQYEQTVAEHFGSSTRVYFLRGLKRWSDEGYEFGWNPDTCKVITRLDNDDRDFAEDDTIFWVDMNHKEFEKFIQSGDFDDSKVQSETFSG